MAKIFVTLLFWFFAAIIFCECGNAAYAQTSCAVIPAPNKYSVVNGSVVLKTSTSVFVSHKSFTPAYEYLKSYLQTKNIQLTKAKKNKSAIQLILLKKKLTDKEAYTIYIHSTGIKIAAANQAGLIYGIVSLLQIIEQSPVTHSGIVVNCCKITDAPAYEWRGIMLDESRHYFGMEKVKAILNWMVFYKLNRFHWHLTDEPAWRIEIKKYPLLALTGGSGTYTNPLAPAQFYSQQQIAEIVKYAAERNITVIPEIDMPGHATAANRAYPQYSGGGSDKHPHFTFHPGRQETYTYLSAILREIKDLFPSALLHLGGDEVSYGNEKWANDSLVLQLMQRQQLPNVKLVERYFMKRMADSVFSMQAKVLAWDEVVDADLPVDKTILFWWRQDHPEQLQAALNKGYKVVLCPRLPLYFDFVQDSTHTNGRKWNKAYNSLQNVYDFSVKKLPAVNAVNNKQVLGMQANVWTETMPNTQRLYYMLFPRIAALAETAWAAKKDFEQFKVKLTKHLALYKTAGINFYQPF